MKYLNIIKDAQSKNENQNGADKENKKEIEAKIAQIEFEQKLKETYIASAHETFNEELPTVKYLDGFLINTD